jgi:UDP-galactopyranose mutase
MTADWSGPFVPTPKLEEVIRGALERQSTEFGYNTSFLYPKSGGIQSLANALAQDLPDLRVNTSFTEVDWKRKSVLLSTGERSVYNELISTVPLPELLKRMSGLPANVKRAAGLLKVAGIYCVNLGVARPKISKASWIYFPERIFPFYRVGFPMNFTPHVVPPGCSSMYVEVPMSRYSSNQREKMIRDVRAGLIQASILKKPDQIPVVQVVPVQYAYVIYDRNRTKALATINAFLAKNRIQSIGRYGAWKYSFMEEAIGDGKAAAERIAARRS